MERGRRGVRLVISDAHSGLKRAISAVFNGSTWQRCYVHFIRDMLSHVPKSAHGFVAAALRNVLQQTTSEHANEAMTKAISLRHERWPKLAALASEAPSPRPWPSAPSSPRQAEAAGLKRRAVGDDDHRARGAWAQGPKRQVLRRAHDLLLDRDVGVARP